MRIRRTVRELTPMLMLAGVFASMTTNSMAQDRRATPDYVDRATRNAAIQRVLTDRLRQTSSLGRAVADLHRSLGVSNQLAHAAVEDLEEGARPSDSDTVRLLALERNNIRVSLDAIRTALNGQPASSASESDSPSQSTRIHHRATNSTHSESRGSLRSTQRHTRGRALHPTPPSFADVERLVVLQTRLNRAIGEGESTQAVQEMIVEIRTAVQDALGEIRRESRPPTGIVLSRIPEVRLTPVETYSE